MRDCSSNSIVFCLLLCLLRETQKSAHLNDMRLVQYVMKGVTSTYPSDNHSFLKELRDVIEDRRDKARDEGGSLTLTRD